MAQCWFRATPPKDELLSVQDVPALPVFPETRFRHCLELEQAPLERRDQNEAASVNCNDWG
jgi:hypothetical protein